MISYKLSFLSLIIAVSILGDTALAQWGTVVSPRLAVSFTITLQPDKEGLAIGAVPLETSVSMDGGVWEDRFTGGGCVSGRFEQATIRIANPSGNEYRFECVCRSRDPKDNDSKVEWVGVLRDGKMSGEMWMTLPGPIMTTEQILTKKKADREALTKAIAVYSGDGQLLNPQAIAEALAQKDHDYDLLPARGRRLHYAFTTVSVEFTPVGDWKAKQTIPNPATQPAKK